MKMNVIRGLIQAACDKGAELYWEEFSQEDFEDDAEMWQLLSEQADERRASLTAATARFSELLGGLQPPASFVDSAAEHGFFDLFGDDEGLLYSFSWVDGNLHLDTLTEMLFTVSPEWVGAHKDGRRIAGMCMPDNPGDMPTYMLVAAFEIRSGDEECLWLYRGGDAAWEDGLELVPIGATYHEVIAMLLSGVASALFLPQDEGKAALQRILDTEEHELARSLLAGLSQLCDACTDTELVADGMNSQILLSEQITKLRPRIAHAAKVLGGLGDLPFGRGPVTIKSERVVAVSREAPR